MKRRFLVVLIVLGGLLILGNSNVVQAQWAAISSGYAVTTNWHGQDVPLGEEVTAFAGTTDLEIQEVEFRWLDPAGNVPPGWSVSVPVEGPYLTPDEIPPGVPQEIIDWAEDNPNILVLLASDSKTPDVLGDWAVQALFRDVANPAKSLRGKNTDIIAIRATSFNVVPEVPFGTIVISLSMFGILGAFILKKKRNMNVDATSL